MSLKRNEISKISLNYSFLTFFFLLSKIISSSPSCKSNTNNCYKCNPLTKLCEICTIPEIYIPNENGGCSRALKCVSGQNYCTSCDIKGELCQKCEDGFIQDEIGVGCTYILNCKVSYKGECLECRENFIKIGKKGELQMCKYSLSEDFLHCKLIDYERGFCKECEENYFLSLENKCIKTENCQ